MLGAYDSCGEQMKITDGLRFAAALNDIRKELSALLTDSENLSASIRIKKMRDATAQSVTFAETEFLRSWTYFKSGLEQKTGEKMSETIRKLRE